LFVGNSYTSTHPLNILLMEISLSQENQYYHIYSEMNAPGGYRLTDHWNNGITVNDIKKRKWDYVVLQGQSTMPLISDYRSIFLKNAKKLDNEIRKSGAKTVLFGTWPYLDGSTTQKLMLSEAFRIYNKRNFFNYKSHYNSIQSIYSKASKDLNASVVFTAPLRHSAPKDTSLYAIDGSHPSLAGSYLVALAFYKHLFSIDKFDENTYIPHDMDKAFGKKLIKYVEEYKL